MTEDDIPANWRDDPLEDTPPVRGAFRGGLLSRLTDEQIRRLREEYQEVDPVADGDLSAGH